MSTPQQKNWQILPKISEKIIKQYPEYSQVVLQLLVNREIISSQSLSRFNYSEARRAGDCDGAEIEKFLNPDYEKYSHDPFLFKDMEKAVKLIIKHIKEQSKIIVYGDYDADGVTASAVLVETLTALKAKVDVYIPDRVSEGYGLNKKAIDKFKKNKVKLVITVDGGIRNKEEIEYAKNLGLDIVVTDHHVAPASAEATAGKPENADELPDCLIINPILNNEKYPYKYLAGVGVAFKLAMALISKSTLPKAGKQKLEEKVLDLAAIGTVADCVSLLGENRVLVKKGLEVLNNTKRIGLQELINVAQINNKVLEAWNIGFQIAPRLNAAGRMEHANTAFELLITKDRQEAAALARRLNDKNIERQKITEKIVEYCVEIVEKEFGDDKILILISPKDKSRCKVRDKEPWPEGVVGLVAGRLCERYSRPVLAITRANSEFKGSGRSIDEFNIVKSIEQAKEFLKNFGGHAAACGLSLKDEKDLEGFIKKIKQIANDKLKNADLRPKISIDAEFDLSEINEKLIKEIEKFAPFGESNPRPKLVSYNAEIRDIVTMGIDGRHIKFRINGFWAVAFGAAERWRDLRINDKIDIVYYAEINEFNGRREVQLKVVDIQKCV